MKNVPGHATYYSKEGPTESFPSIIFPVKFHFSAGIQAMPIPTAECPLLPTPPVIPLQKGKAYWLDLSGSG